MSAQGRPVGTAVCPSSASLNSGKLQAVDLTAEVDEQARRPSTSREVTVHGYNTSLPADLLQGSRI